MSTANTVLHALKVTCPTCGRMPDNACTWEDKEDQSRGILIHAERIAAAHAITVYTGREPTKEEQAWIETLAASRQIITPAQSTTPVPSMRGVCEMCGDRLDMGRCRHHSRESRAAWLEEHPKYAN